MSSIFADLLTNSLRTAGEGDSDTEDLSTLPFPQPLSRPSFSTPDFDTEAFLLAHSQYRTLDDLRGELRTWVDKLEAEMERVIEEDWQGYLSLGTRLAGGDAGVKEAERRIRAVEKDVQEVRRRVEERIREYDGVMLERLRIRENAAFARRLLAIHSSLQSLERALLLVEPAQDSILVDIDSLTSMTRLAQLSSQYRELCYLLTKCSASHPFLKSLRPRMEKVRTTLTKDFKDAIVANKQRGNALEAFNLLQLAAKTDLKIL